MGVWFAGMFLASLLFRGVPLFHHQGYIQAGGGDLDVGSYSSPLVADWNGDGVKDLIVGELDDGMINFFENTGTNQNPLFGPSVHLRADGSEITMSYG